MAGKEVTVSSTQGLSRAISEVASLLETHKVATISAINLAIPSAVNLVEMIKHRVKGIYQENSFEKVPESNKTRVVFKLSLLPLDASQKGYQSPISESQVTEKTFEEMRKPPTASAYLARKAEGESKGEVFPSSRRGGRGGRDRRGRGRGRSSRGGPERSYEPREFNERRSGRGRRARRGGRIGEPREREPGMEKYQLKRNIVDTPKLESELFVSTRVNPIFAIKDGLMMFKKKGMSTITIKASGQAVSKALKVAEEIRVNEPGLHQQKTNEKRVVKDVWVPTEEGLSEIVKERTIDGVQIVLSKVAVDPKHQGYSAPLAADQVKNLTVEQVEKL